ncbi:MAG TPA: extracellular solute-binding protein [bacterium]|nr:extracellular solute-binding protein [bacterium]
MIRGLAGLMILLFLCGGLTAAASAQTVPASLPKATQKMLKEIKLEATLLAGLDEELKVPRAWMDGARKEGKLRIFSTWDPPQAEEILGPFKERYPFLSITYNRASHEDRAIKTVMAYKQGRIVTDVITGLGGSFFLYRDAGALEDMRDIPNLKNNLPKTQDPSGQWVGMHMRYWCMAYNPKLVKKSDLPKKWEDFLTNPIWKNRNLALGNRPQLWALQLWKVKGEKWMTDYLTRMFTEVKPQLRKEGMNAMLELTVAGEFYANIPAAEYRTYQKVVEGAPVSYTCPEPVPSSSSEMGILRKAPNINAAKLFVNWFLSKEGQIAQYAADFAPPVHKGLQRRELLPFAEEILGKEQAFREPGDELEIQPKLLKLWEEMWLRGGSKKG